MLAARLENSLLTVVALSCALALLLSGCGGSKPAKPKKKDEPAKTEDAEKKVEPKAEEKTDAPEPEAEPKKEGSGTADTKDMGDALKKAADMKKDLEKTTTAIKKTEPAKMAIVLKGEGAEENLAGKSVATWLNQLNADNPGDVKEALLALENAGHFEVVKANKATIEELSKHANADIANAAKSLLEKMK